MTCSPLTEFMTSTVDPVRFTHTVNNHVESRQCISSFLWSPYTLRKLRSTQLKSADKPFLINLQSPYLTIRQWRITPVNYPASTKYLNEANSEFFVKIVQFLTRFLLW